MLDPYPLMTVDYAVAALRARFGGENVICEEGEVAVRIHRPGGELTLVILTAEQAKYLTAHPIGAEDLTNEKYPVGWPSPAKRTDRLSPGRPIHASAAPVPFGIDQGLRLLRKRDVDTFDLSVDDRGLVQDGS
jgi:hypothetical protein